MTNPPAGIDAAAGPAPVQLDSKAALAAARPGLPAPVVLVPTMGALHAGHAALLDAAGPGCVLSVFVNPLQFGAGEDLARYPRTLDHDLEVAAAHGVGVVFAPSVEEMYPAGAPRVTVSAGALGRVLEGASRPGHFDGVLTVVAKLFGLVRPALAVFGEKDFQQLQLVRALVDDLDLGVQVLGVPTVRDHDGLALSSRNRYLSAEQRGTAVAIPRALATADPAAARALLGSTPGLDLDYCVLVDPVTLSPTTRSGRLLVAARVGATRLIDNAPVP